MCDYVADHLNTTSTIQPNQVYAQLAAELPYGIQQPKVFLKRADIVVATKLLH